MTEFQKLQLWFMRAVLLSLATLLGHRLSCSCGACVDIRGCFIQIEEIAQSDRSE